jgi:tRNA uridine 5-carboxymethylaminomethyl modification enzyme
MLAIQRVHPADHYAVIVVGAGHAGCEAALAAARMGRRTLLLTMNLDLIAQMPCNPSIGGPAKGHLVREIDALGGEMARAIDRTFIQIRLLNTSKGPAVQALRAQADKRLYALSMKHTLESTPNLHLKQGHVETLLRAGDRVVGVGLASGETFTADAVVIASGTFLEGRILRGEYVAAAGRAGEPAAQGLARSLREAGLELGRLQTNTPPRIDARTIRYEYTVHQFGSETPRYFSFAGPSEEPLTLPIHPAYPIERQTAWRPQMPCYLVHTNEETHRVIRENLHRSPIAPGKLDARGPRYCPSIEEKLVRFPDKARHPFFLEPEGWATGEVYVQGCFTGLPVDVQRELLHTIPALADGGNGPAVIMRPGYAIEYAYVLPHQLRPTLEVRGWHGLFLAGQINGTSGYEEAAAQGLIAGINAARLVADEEPLLLGRHEAYIGVLIDDLITGMSNASDGEGPAPMEPYRMLTSRAEYRLLLRGDNADLRLTPIGHRLGLAGEERYRRVEAKREAVQVEIERLKGVTVRPSADLVGVLDEPTSAHQLLKRPGVDYETIQRLAPPSRPLSDEEQEQVVLQIRYEGYIDKQERQVNKARRLEAWRLPEDLDYTAIPGLSNEARQSLSGHCPATVGQASRIRGVTPADISMLLIYLERHGRVKAAGARGG